MEADWIRQVLNYCKIVAFLLGNVVHSLIVMLLMFQVPAESLRYVSSLISATGKMPILTPPTPLMSCGHCLLLSHWSLAVSLVSVYGGNLSKKNVDRALVAAGYTMGPFQAMKKVAILN